MKSIPSNTQAHIIELLRSGTSTRAVAKQVGVSQSTVARVRAGTKESISTPQNGRPRKLSERSAQYSARLMATGKATTAVTVQKILRENLGVHVDRRTVARTLGRSGLSAFIKRKKPLLSKKHKERRLAFAQRHKSWTVDDWKRVVFSDETKINRYGSDGREYYWKKRGEPLRDHHVQPTVKHGGGSIMVWSCFTANGPGYPCMVEGNMTAEDYRRILQSDLLDTLDHFGMKMADTIFQHDNDPKHTAISVREWLAESGLQVLEWPSQSPDLNPIEYLWWTVKHRLKQYQTVARNNDELWERVVEIWNNINEDECMNLIESMPRRVAAVLAAKGSHTKY